MSTQSRARIRMPEKLREDGRHSTATDVKSKVPPPDRHVATSEANQESASALASFDARPLAAAPQFANHEALLSSVGNNDAAHTPALAEAIPKPLAAKFASYEESAAPDDKPATKAAADGDSGASDELATAVVPTMDAPSAEPGGSPPGKAALELATGWCAAPSKSPADNAPSKAENSSATPLSPKTEAATPHEAGKPIPDQDATDIVASCEDKTAPSASKAGETIPLASEKVTTLPPELQAAIDRCLAVRNRPGSFIGWGERSEETAAAALDLVALMMTDHEALKAVRKTVNEERKNRGERALNKSTSKELLAVFLCAPPKTKAERQECSRFSNVIVVAAHEKRTSGNVGEWLKTTSLTEALEKAAFRKGKAWNKSHSVAITRNKYPQLWANYQTPEVRNAIEKALKSVDKSLKKGVPDAR